MNAGSTTSGSVLSLAEGDGRLTFTLEGPDGRSSLEFESEAPFNGGYESGLAAALIPAMAAGRPLHVSGSVSERLLDGVTRFQSILGSMAPGLSPVSVTTEGVQALETSAGRGVGVFFSLGIDSSYTLAAKMDEITHLIFIEGFDPMSVAQPLWDHMKRRAAEVASRTGKELVVVSCNLRDVAGSKLGWLWMHGPSLAAVGHAVSSTVERVYISSSWPYRNLLAWGTHPLLDHLWSSEVLAVDHFGAEFDRSQKLEHLVRHFPEALDWLRVCASSITEYNCGRCGKCLRAMAVLEAHGELTGSPTFPDEIDLRDLRRIPTYNQASNLSTRLTLTYLNDRDLAPTSQRALRRTLRRSARRKLVLESLPERLRIRARRSRIFNRIF